MNRFCMMVLALGFFGLVATDAMAKEKPDYDDQIKYKDLPDPVKATVDKERGKRDIVKLWHVRRDGREFYRAQIDTKGEDTSIRISPEGNVISAAEVKDPPTKEVTGPVKKEIKLAKDASEGEEVDLNKVPANVRQEITRLARKNKVHEVIKYRHRNNTWYRAEVGEGNTAYFIRVPENFEPAKAKAEVSTDVEPGELIAFDRTPGKVKTKIGALAKSGKVEEVTVYERGGHKYYQALIDAKAGPDYVVTVDEAGNQLERLPKV